MLISIHEFKSHLAKYIAQAQSGSVIELTSHRKVVARITGVPQHGPEGIDKLLAAGAATWRGGQAERRCADLIRRWQVDIRDGY